MPPPPARLRGRLQLVPVWLCLGLAALRGMIAVCPAARTGRALKVVLTSLVAAGVLSVAFLALYAGAHTFTDIIGGMVLGGAVVALGRRGAECHPRIAPRLRRRADRRSFTLVHLTAGLRARLGGIDATALWW